MAWFARLPCSSGRTTTQLTGSPQLRARQGLMTFSRLVLPNPEIKRCPGADTVSRIQLAVPFGRRRRVVSGANWSVLETLIAAPPPGIAGSRTISRYHFGAFDVGVGKRLCTLNRRYGWPCRGRAVAGRGGKSNAAVYGWIARGCSRCPRGDGAAGNSPLPRVLWPVQLLGRSDHDAGKRSDAAHAWIGL